MVIQGGIPSTSGFRPPLPAVPWSFLCRSRTEGTSGNMCPPNSMELYLENTDVSIYIYILSSNIPIIPSPFSFGHSKTAPCGGFPVVFGSDPAQTKEHERKEEIPPHDCRGLKGLRRKRFKPYPTQPVKTKVSLTDHIWCFVRSFLLEVLGEFFVGIGAQA